MISLSDNISNNTDILRLNINKKLHKNKSKLEQYFSSASIAQLMASMMNYKNKEINILDPGAGIGSLFVACIDEIITQKIKPKKISITAYEVDASLFTYLDDALDQCAKICKKNKINFSSKLIKKDFIVDIVSNLKNAKKQYSHIIMNPPYKKLNSFTKVYLLLKEANLQSVNLYSAFIVLSQKILQDNGELVFISPRSFCNGPYFQSFRKKFLESMSIKRIHIFNSRSSSFRDDHVLQENVIIYAIKAQDSSHDVLISSNSGPKDEVISVKQVKKESVISPNDYQYFIHIIHDEIGAQILNKMKKLQSTLEELDIQVSTGKIVDFRIKEALNHKSNYGTAPLIHPFNLSKGMITFPVPTKKENYIKITKKSKKQLVKNGNYVLIKRFSTKEEKRRIVASIWKKSVFNCQLVGFENHLNYFHSNGKSLKLEIVKGLSVFLNSTIVDLYFRQFNGHTQVNATDLRYLRYPTHNQLKILGRIVTNTYPEQKDIDSLIDKVLFGLNKNLK